MPCQTRTVIGVMGSGREPHHDLAAPLGQWLAEAGYDLLTGGGEGVMRSVSEAFCAVQSRSGISIGVIPGELTHAGYQPKPGYPNPFIELPIYTHLPLSGERGDEPLSRNHINVLTPAVIIALPGGAGTRSEIMLAGQRYGRPVITFGDAPDATPLEVNDAHRPPRATRLAEVQAFVRSQLAS